MSEEPKGKGKGITAALAAPFRKLTGGYKSNVVAPADTSGAAAADRGDARVVSAPGCHARSLAPVLVPLCPLFSAHVHPVWINARGIST